jgi:hypothetical protein
MDAATVTAIGVLGSALVAGLAAMYGSRIAGRTQREGGVIGGYNSLTDQPQGAGYRARRTRGRTA